MTFDRPFEVLDLRLQIFVDCIPFKVWSTKEIRVLFRDSLKILEYRILVDELEIVGDDYTFIWIQVKTTMLMWVNDVLNVIGYLWNFTFKVKKIGVADKS